MFKKPLALFAMKIGISVFVFFTSVFLLNYPSAKAQDISTEGIPGLIIAPSYSAQIPLGDLSNRFGFFNSIGGYLGYKLRSNWIIGAEAGLTFSANVKEKNMLDQLLDEDNLLVGNSGVPEAYEFQHRGYHVRLQAGKVFDLFGPNPNSGLLVQLGGGFWSHRILIDIQDNLFPQLIGDYRQGYDRMTNGFMLSQFVGYLHLSNKNFFNFYVGLEFVQGFTQGRRAYQFDLMAPLNDNRFDGSIGLKIGWIIPVYPEGSTEYYMY
jgi:hypothetical protein